jgi:exosortase/archaeosortase family protein
VRESRDRNSKDDISWAEVGEMSYGYLRIPMTLILVQVIYWWATEPDASLEPLQVFLAWFWSGCSNLFWPGSAELVFHGPSQSWTGVNLIGSGFINGEVPLYVDAECAGVNEIMFLGTLMLLTPGVENRIRNRSLLGMAVIVQFLNFLRLLALYPIGMQYGEAEMNEMHEFIFKQGFLILLVVFWFIWFIMLERNGLRDIKSKPALSDLKKFKNIEMRDTLPRGSVIALIICAILAVWSTYEVTMNDENLRFKGVAEDCEYDTLDGYIDSEGTPCFDEMNIWNNVWDRTIRGWLFAGLIGAIAIVRIKPEVKDLGEEE